MKGYVIIFFGGLIILILVSSCDRSAEVAIVKNNIKSDILVECQPDELMTDSILYNFYLNETLVMPGNTESIYVPLIGDRKAYDLEKVYLYILNRDSLTKYKNLGKSDGILGRSLIKKVEIRLNKTQFRLDTIYINTASK